MKRVVHFFQLIRWSNLLFIAITQLLFYFSIFNFSYAFFGIAPEKGKLDLETFYPILFASLCIAAAGYIINDYFDVEIDRINKSGKVLIGKVFNNQIALWLYALLTLAGLIFTVLAAFHLNNFFIFIFNSLAVLLLFLYSRIFKRKFLTGNIVVSALTAWTLFIFPVAEYNPGSLNNQPFQLILKFALIYGLFAFIISLIREVIKDMEDTEGDKNYDCTTLPIVMGIKAAKAYSTLLILILSILLSFLIGYISQNGWWNLAIYGVFFILFPLIFILKKLQSATTSKDFGFLSKSVKFIMLTGILSMTFFLFFK
ncbi:MAG: geranylgeranylglycerol-phosphate geranylgeranyltransferase [Chitinophagaceae bacterium]|nr:geranylgeranylglycerol-phosphate geranylgeranyltransferase [Chitinophagaceae bacterium]